MITETKREKERSIRRGEKDGVVGYEGGGAGDGHVLDLDIVIKYGVLGGVGGGVVGACVEKLDLKKMIEELDLYEVQSMFICLIPLEAMQDPTVDARGLWSHHLVFAMI